VDAALLGALGYDVTGFDLSPNMVALAIERGVRAELGSIESLGALSLVDAVWSNFGALNCMDPSQVGRVLARLIRPGGVFLAVCISPRCPIEELALAAKFRWPLRRGAQTAVRGILVPMRYPRVVDWKQLLSPAFQLIRVQALGVVVPPPDLGGSVGRASAVDAAVGRVPILRHFGDHTLSLWRRRG
jgi:SAM-dependent methyltransferase